MEKIILYSNRDVAGRNIAKILKEKFGLESFEHDGEILRMKNFHENPELCIVASRHESKSGIPTLTTHSPGNFGTAAAGGNNKELGIAPALYLRGIISSLVEEKEKNRLEYEVSLEATHHGPTDFRFPILFAEVGSSLEQWNDIDACNAVANAIERAMNSKPEKIPTAIGFGGGHYCRKFSKVDEFAIGHVCPKYNLHELDSEMIEQMISKTIPKPEFALVEKKGMGSEKGRVLELLENSGLEIVMV